MIWTLKIECISGMYLQEECVRVVELDSGTSLEGLHLLILRLVKFQRDHLYEFYSGRHYRNRKIEYSSVESIGFSFGDAPPEIESDDDLTIEDVYPLPSGLQLFYHFDFGADWYFKITRSRRKPRHPEPGVQYPRVVESHGPAPLQYSYSEDWGTDGDGGDEDV